MTHSIVFCIKWVCVSSISSSSSLESSFVDIKCIVRRKVHRVNQLGGPRHLRVRVNRDLSKGGVGGVIAVGCPYLPGHPEVQTNCPLFSCFSLVAHRERKEALAHLNIELYPYLSTRNYDLELQRIYRGPAWRNFGSVRKHPSKWRRNRTYLSLPFPCFFLRLGH